MGIYKLLRITDIQNDNVNWETVPFTDIEESEAVNFVLENNDFLFARTGATVGKSYLVKNLDTKSVYASYLIRISLLSKESINYVKYFFNSGFYWEQISEKSVGIGQPNVNGSSLKELKIPLPPFPEQHRIVSKIEEIFAVIDTIEQNQSDLKTTIEKTKAKVLDMAIRGELLNDENHHLETLDNEHYTDEEFPFPIPKHWKWKKLGEIVSIGLGLTYNPNYVSKGIPFLSVSNLKENYIDLENVKYISEEDYRNASELSLPKKGDILFGRVGTLGKPKIVEFEEKYCTYVSLGTLKNKNINLTNTKFVKFWMESNLFWTQVNTNVKGSTLKNLNTNWLKDFLIPLPPLEEQQKIVQKIEKIFAELDFIEQNL